MDLGACTIIARNYLPAARVLAKSFRVYHPDCRFTTLIVDDIKGEVDEAAEPFDVLRLDDLGIEHDEALRMAAIYDVTELCTALKPWLLERLLDSDAGTVVYLDPDIKMYGPLDEVAGAAEERGIVLTPHVTRPMPRDGLSKSETEVLLSGIYNLGFIALTELARDFLSFWQIRLKRECIVDPSNMRFVDQRWVDFAPGLYPVYILRDTTYNVAYWNLDQRDLVFRDGRYFVDGSPLHFFHFSGYSPQAPYLLSKHQGLRPRILLSDRPDVARICDEYAADLLANGYGSGSPPEYGFKHLANGIELDAAMRRLYRAALLGAERSGEALPPNPLGPGSAEAFLGFLTEPDDDGNGKRLSRYLSAVHAARLDLQRAYPDPEGADFLGFSTWVHNEVEGGRLDRRLGALPVPPAGTRVRLTAARQLERVGNRLGAVPLPGTGDERVRVNMARSVQRIEHGLAKVPVPAGGERLRLNMTRSLGRLERRLAAVPVPGTSDERVRLNMARLVGRVERRLAAVPAAEDANEQPHAVPADQVELSPGIRIAGYLRTESGIGELGRLTVATAESAGIRLSTFLDTNALSRQSHHFEPTTGDFNVNIICVNADELPNFANRVGRDFFRDHYTIGLWAWELEEFPHRFSTSFDYVDEVWSISTFARDAIAAASTKPVYAFSLPIVEPEVVRPIDRGELGIPDSFVFLFCFDLLSIFERKNPLGLIEAFSKAFKPGEGPSLVIKVINGQIEATSLERLKWAASQRPDVVVIDEYLDRDANTALMAACDCYVSLHRSEGFGLTLAEAMALGKPVIATAYSGNLDFMTPETSYLVPWRPGVVPVGCSPYPPGARWAEPDLDAAARIMRDVYENPATATEVGRRAREHVLADHSVNARAGFLRERFAAAQEELRDRDLATSNPEGLEPTGSRETLVDIVARRPSVDAPSRHPRAARAFRRSLWRVLQSHDDYDREVHIRLAAAAEKIFDHLGRISNEVDRIDDEVVRLDDEVERLEEVLREEMRKLDRVDSDQAKLETAFEASLTSQSRVEELESHILARVEVLTKTMAERQPTWDSDHRLHDTLLRRLTAIERTVRPSESVDMSGRPDVAGIASNLRDFLGVDGPDDVESTAVRVGQLEVDIPSWDTVILPWVREYGEWEPAVATVLEQAATPGAVVIDVGAHVGIFTLPLSAWVGPSGKVVAVEADPVNARFLRRNLRKAHCENVMVLEVAASDKTGTLTLSRSVEDNTGDSRAYDIPGAGQVLEVPSLALDEVVSGPVHLIKLDIQGTDHVAMRGMSRIIEQYKPVIVTEFWPEAIREYGNEPLDVLAWFRDLGYGWQAVELSDVTDLQSDQEVCAAAEGQASGYFDLLLRPKA